MPARPCVAEHMYSNPNQHNVRASKRTLSDTANPHADGTHPLIPHARRRTSSAGAWGWHGGEGAMRVHLNPRQQHIWRGKHALPRLRSTPPRSRRVHPLAPRLSIVGTGCYRSQRPCRPLGCRFLSSREMQKCSLWAPIIAPPINAVSSRRRGIGPNRGLPTPYRALSPETLDKPPTLRDPFLISRGQVGTPSWNPLE